MRFSLRAVPLAVLFAAGAVPAGAQSQSITQTSTPAVLAIYREEVRPGKSGAHAINEASWAAAFAKSQAPVRWLAMTSVAGPSEAWFLSGYPSWEAFERLEAEMDANAGFAADEEKFSSAESDLLSRTSVIVATHRPDLSYQANVALPKMRYMEVRVMRVKPGHAGDFSEVTQAIVAAHQKAKLEEHWAVYQVTAGMPDGTFLYFFPRKSLAELDKDGPLHEGAAYRDALGESGRARRREMQVGAIESTQTMVFRFEPNMSILGKDWIDGDPAFWTPKPPPAPPAKKK